MASEPDSSSASDTFKWVNTLLNNPLVRSNAAAARFGAFDINGDGKLRLQELKALCLDLCSKLGVQPWSDDRVLDLFERFDANKDEALNRKEFGKLFDYLLKSHSEEVCGLAQAEAAAQRVTLELAFMSGEKLGSLTAEADWEIDELTRQVRYLIPEDKLLENIVRTEDKPFGDGKETVKGLGLRDGEILTVVLKETPPWHSVDWRLHSWDNPAPGSFLRVRKELDFDDGLMHLWKEENGLGCTFFIDCTFCGKSWTERGSTLNINRFHPCKCGAR